MNAAVRVGALGRALAVLAVVAALLAISSPAGAGAADAAGCPAPGTRLAITRSTRLDPRCTYGGIDVTTSNVTLDCAGALVAGDPARGGLGIAIRTPSDVALRHVTVRNCRVQGFLNNLRVTRDGFRTLPPGDEFAQPTSDIVIENNRFGGSRGVGVYVDAYVSGVTIRANQVRGAGSSGIYLEAGSRRSVVANNTIADNGFVQNGPGGQTATLLGATFTFWGVGREGLSVDGSYENTIVANVFEGNSAGGIFLYKNCGENVGSPGYFPRRDAAARNLIQWNTFRGGRNGVWVGSRMGENLLPMSCSDPAYVSEGLLRVVLDHADHNVVRANRFSDVTYGVRVEDDDTTVDGNWFSGTSSDRHAVFVGTPYRTTRLGLPVRGTVITGNVSTIAGNANPYRWLTGETATTVQGNWAGGRRVGICQGPEVPRQPFIFVIAAALANPDGTPPPTPDLTVAEVGPLPPCP